LKIEHRRADRHGGENRFHAQSIENGGYSSISKSMYASTLMSH
jgi:hypothetical protein